MIRRITTDKFAEQNNNTLYKGMNWNWWTSHHLLVIFYPAPEAAANVSDTQFIHIHTCGWDSHNVHSSSLLKICQHLFFIFTKVFLIINFFKSVRERGREREREREKVYSSFHENISLYISVITYKSFLTRVTCGYKSARIAMESMYPPQWNMQAQEFDSSYKLWPPLSPTSLAPLHLYFMTSQGGLDIIIAGHFLKNKV